MGCFRNVAPLIRLDQALSALRSVGRGVRARDYVAEFGPGEVLVVDETGAAKDDLHVQVSVHLATRPPIMPGR